MKSRRMFSLVVLLLVLSSAGQTAQSERKTPKLTEQIFRRTSSLYLNDPSNASARDWARLILLYALDKPNAAVVLEREEWRWSGMDTRSPHSLHLLAAFEAGNIQSQLNSGVKRNDRYSGLLTLFRVYRALQEQDKTFRVDAVADLLTLHQEGKLVSHLQRLDEKKPTRLTAPEEAMIRDLLRTR